MFALFFVWTLQGTCVLESCLGLLFRLMVLVGGARFISSYGLKKFRTAKLCTENTMKTQYKNACK